MILIFTQQVIDASTQHGVQGQSGDANNCLFQTLEETAPERFKECCAFLEGSTLEQRHQFLLEVETRV